MRTCPSCGFENADSAKFCSECGSALAAAPSVLRQERKVVTVVFADLVGSTARAERLDPEDVRAILAPYHDRLRRELERRGGTVEKFIGDAVVGVFGAPIAHEDDPERAVRAALAIQEGIAELNESDPTLELEVRIGVNTGEALVNLAARPEAGESMVAGDVMNTGARLQAGAPPGGVLVSDATYRMTDRTMQYEAAEPLTAKGKAEALDVWLAIAPRARLGVDIAGAGRGPLVGRTRELDALVGALARTRGELEPQLVTLVGVPGIGKSRLVYELSQIVDADPELITWRQGRSLPYGEGVPFWALGEMVKAQAGVFETDDSDEATAKLSRMIADLVPDDGEAAWIERHARPLVGLAADDSGREELREEAAAAWRRLVEALAEWRPSVLVFEDIHWGGDGLLDFVDGLVDWVRGVPLLVVATARPELLERRPSWGGGKRNAVTLSLSPLSDEDTARLIASLLDRSLLLAETQSSLLAAAGGNPLYAEEFARMQDQGGDDADVPGTLQAIVAARVDSLPPSEKSVLQAGAVLGKVFWSSAIAALGGEEPRELDDRLRALERKEFVRRERRSTVEGEQQYMFLHALIRDVAYGLLPRSERAEKHRLAAEWIGSLARPEDQADMLAHHYLAALEFARAAGQETASIAERARFALRDAGDRALALDSFEAAERFYGQAVELWPRDDAERPLLLLAYGRVLAVGTGGFEVLTEARDSLLAAGDVERAAEAEARLGHLARLAGRVDEAWLHLERAAELVEGRAASPSVAFVLWTFARGSMLAGENEKAIEVGRRALAIAEELGLEQVRAGALTTIGTARAESGDLEGLHDLERSIEIAEAARSSEAFRGYGNLGSVTLDLGDVRRARELTERSLESAQRFGHGDAVRWQRGNRLELLFAEGQWDEVLEECDKFLAEVDAGSPHYLEPAVRVYRAQIRLARSDVAGALADAEVGLERARDVREPQMLHPALAEVALLFLGAGRTDQARQAMGELLVLGPSPASFVTFAIVLTAFGRSADAVAAADSAVLQTRWVDAARAYVEGDLVRTAELLDEIGHLPLEAYVRLRAAERFAEEGRKEEAELQLESALVFYRSVRATRYIREGEVLLAASA